MNGNHKCEVNYHFAVKTLCVRITAVQCAERYGNKLPYNVALRVDYNAGYARKRRQI